MHFQDYFLSVHQLYFQLLLYIMKYLSMNEHYIPHGRESRVHLHIHCYHAHLCHVLIHRYDCCYHAHLHHEYLHLYVNSRHVHLHVNARARQLKLTDLHHL